MPTLHCTAEQFQGCTQAKEIIQQAIDSYTDLFVPKRQR